MSRDRGRPEKFGSAFVRAFKQIVRQHGLIKGAEIINASGVLVFGGKGGNQHHQVSISLPTLVKYIKRDGQGGKPVLLKRGRPAKAA
jgi:hypothetical protein